MKLKSFKLLQTNYFQCPPKYNVATFRIKWNGKHQEHVQCLELVDTYSINVLYDAPCVKTSLKNILGSNGNQLHFNLKGINLLPNAICQLVK